MYATGPPDPTINKLLPLKSDSASKSSATSDAKPPPSNKRKAGNTNIKNYYKVQKPKQVLDMTGKDAEKTEQTSNTALALDNIDACWRTLREEQDAGEELKKLNEPALPHERHLWNIQGLNYINLDELPNKPASNNNFKDYLGYYSLIGMDSDWKSLPSGICKQCRIKKSNHQKDILAAHLDENNGIDKGSQKINEIWRKVESVYKIFNEQNSDSSSGHILHDVECDKLRQS